MIFSCLKRFDSGANLSLLIYLEISTKTFDCITGDNWKYVEKWKTTPKNRKEKLVFHVNVPTKIFFKKSIFIRFNRNSSIRFNNV